MLTDNPGTGAVSVPLFDICDTDGDSMIDNIPGCDAIIHAHDISPSVEDQVEVIKVITNELNSVFVKDDTNENVSFNEEQNDSSTKASLPMYSMNYAKCYAPDTTDSPNAPMFYNLLYASDELELPQTCPSGVDQEVCDMLEIAPGNVINHNMVLTG
ncbi:hypothetical protein KIPB_012120, partial [Kipferlia bialata]|eukprot:g12120.t1